MAHPSWSMLDSDPDSGWDEATAELLAKYDEEDLLEESLALEVADPTSSSADVTLADTVLCEESMLALAKPCSSTLG